MPALKDRICWNLKLKVKVEPCICTLKTVVLWVLFVLRRAMRLPSSLGQTYGDRIQSRNSALRIPMILSL